MKPIVVFITTPDETTAVKIAKTLVNESLAACINIVPVVRSIYKWKGEIYDERESLLVIKTMEEKLNDLINKVRQMHPYEVPEIIALPIIGGHDGYIKWVEDIVKG
jgi:periplasmic divalent cation tolerance protein